MSIVLPALAVAFAAFWIWLGLRIVNRRERWAKWTAGLLVAVLLSYLLSFGPACGLVGRGCVANHFLRAAYFPILSIYRYGPEFTAEAIYRYSSLWTESEGHFNVEFEDVCLGL